MAGMLDQLETITDATLFISQAQKEPDTVRQSNSSIFHVTMPATSSVYLVQESAQDLLHLLRNPAPEAPFAVFGTETSVALAKISRNLCAA